MGYVTNYELRTKEKVKIADFIEKIKDIGFDYVFSEEIEDMELDVKDNPDVCYAIDISSSESYKWYENEDDMKELSKSFSDVVFELYGEGEESGDLWLSYHKNGKVQRENAKIVYADFDENKLK